MKFLDFQQYPRAWFTLMLAVCLACITILSGCATPPAATPAERAADQPLTAHDAMAARALALQKVGESATDGETKRLAIFALMSLDRGSAPAPAPVVVQQGGRTVGDVIFGVIDRTFERALAVAPAYLAYKGQTRAAQTTERVAEINRDISINQSNNFMALGVAGITGTQNVGVAGMGALASVAGQPRTSITVSGSGLTNIGSGTIDTRRTCTGGNSQAGTGTATVPAATGQGGAANC